MASHENGGTRSCGLIGMLCAALLLLLLIAHADNRTAVFRSAGLRTLDNESPRRVIDFAVCGFPKTGTTYLLHYLLNTEETFMGGKEHCMGKPGTKKVEKLLSLYKQNRRTADGVPIKNGLKCPKGLTDEFGIANYEQWLPDTNFIVSIRHPVWWFQSFYNYRLKQHIRHGKEPWKPQLEELIGPCSDGSPYVLNTFAMNETHREGVCTDASKFHHFLSRFGKTPMIDQTELALLEHNMSIHSLPRAKVFLMEIGQLSIENETRADIFVQDIQEFIGLENGLPLLKAHVPSTISENITRQFINICDRKHDFIRSILVENGRDAYLWIRDYFMKSPDVVISSSDHFLELIEQWQRDPCIDEKAI